MEMELIERYIYAVTYRLHEKQRKDIEQELRGLIEDMLDDRLQGRAPSRKDVEEVLQELGNPRLLADQYRGYKRYLISPEMFPFYLTVMKIVLASIGLGMFVAFCVQSIMNPASVLDHFVNSLVTFLNGCLQGFAWVTIIFGLIEYAGVKKDVLNRSVAWKPADLPELPDHQSQIKRSDPIASIIFTILFAVLISFSFDLLGIWRFQDGESASVVPFFNESVMQGFLPFIWIVLALTLLKDCIKLITRKWSVKLLSFDIIISLASLVLLLFMFSDTSIWNNSFMEQIEQIAHIPRNSEDYESLLAIWNASKSVTVYAAVIVMLFAIGSSAYKMFRLIKK